MNKKISKKKMNQINKLNNINNEIESLKENIENKYQSIEKNNKNLTNYFKNLLKTFIIIEDIPSYIIKEKISKFQFNKNF